MFKQQWINRGGAGWYPTSQKAVSTWLSRSQYIFKYAPLHVTLSRDSAFYSGEGQLVTRNLFYLRLRPDKSYIIVLVEELVFVMEVP